LEGYISGRGEEVLCGIFEELIENVESCGKVSSNIDGAIIAARGRREEEGHLCVSVSVVVILAESFPASSS